MHASVMTWVGRTVRRLGLADRYTLEVGSRNYNGSVREHFTHTYVGVDMEEGKDVDVVAMANDLPYSNDEFDVVVTTEMLEHDPYFWQSVPEMARVLKPGGHFLLTTRGIGFPLHEYPSDYWRFTPAAIRHLVTGAGLEVIELKEDPQVSGVFVLARKRP